MTSMIDRSPVASRLAAFGESVFTPFSRLAREHEAINLGQGFPNFEGPQVVRDAAIQALRDGHNQYAPPNGLPRLQEAIAQWTEAGGGAAVDPATEVTVTSGCTEAIPATLLGLVEPGDEVIVLEPFYDAYPAAISMAGATMVTVPLIGPDFTVDTEALRAVFGPRTRAILLNTPHNPTGTVIDRATMELIAACCREHDVICITDEVYERLVFEGEHVRMRTLPGMHERTVTLSSLGKTFSFTGWKIGWAVAPPPLTEGIRAAHQYLTYAVAHPLQHAAVAALELPESYFDEFVAGYRQRRDVLVDGLREVGFGVTAPAGTYFVLADHSAFGFPDDWAFCRHLVTEVGVAAIPPSAFHRTEGGGRNLARFAFCKDLPAIEAAVERIRERLRPAV
jgi:aspartate/methionine/tyrosine aminotransferase